MRALRKIDRILSKKELDELDKIKDVKVACLGPNDVVIIKHPTSLTQYEIDSISAILSDIFKDNNVLLLSDGMEIEILRR